MRCYLFLILTVLSFPLLAKKSDTILVATAIWEPNFTNGQGTGLYETLFKQVYADYNIKFFYTSYERSKTLVKEGKVDAWLGSYEQEEAFAIYPQLPFDADEVTAIYRADREIDDNFAQALSEGSVAWIKGYDFDKYFGDILKQPYLLLDNETGLKMVLNGRIDFMIDDSTDVQEMIDKFPDQYSQLRTRIFAHLPLFPGFADTTKGKKLASEWDTRLVALKEQGSVHALFVQFDVPYVLDEPQVVVARLKPKPPLTSDQ
ncbi:transporter substrate-binding domain-containing protein [Aestuariibacter halophilus]|uniref:Transporter substrate-binding domain-containing protein n=1 Tax=Fluctibacter halophilus TaxID=226011 RepID=A0ABS8G482_9ALTE|nr:transporter substrate-binding domain-containing protein [Aestuariibacter halophilus]MCC2615243.1 transporter substrate-binding domain-containing protein [Aestuariibacter halophilus]